MTAFAISSLRWARATGVRRMALILAVLLAAIAVATIITVKARADAATAAQMPPARATMLLKVASGDAVRDMRAVGDEAKLLNAALPFSSSPIPSTDPFRMAGGDIDQRRAELCLTQAVYYEAGFEPLEGRRAVAQVVLNRTRHPAYPRSICGVVYQRSNNNICQFTFVCDGALNRAPATASWHVAQQVARAALAGYVEKTVGSATHYHADYVSPRWAPMLAKVAQLGQHIFYRWPGAWGRPGAFVGRYVGEPRDPLTLRPALATIASDGTMVGADLAIAGPPVARAPNDVGGLLDTSKGWTLNIPGPESESAAARLIAAQEGKASDGRRKSAVSVTAMATTPGN
ncbi:MAG: cell wall hydrolase [Sphingomicrobium sp.]